MKDLNVLAAMQEGHESAVLGFLMSYPQRFPEFVLLITPNLFTYQRNHIIWDTLHQLAASKTGISLLSVTDSLRQQGKLEAVGGAVYLTRLAGDFFINDAAMDYALDQLRSSASLRAVAAIGQKMTQGDMRSEDAICALTQVTDQIARNEPVALPPPPYQPPPLDLLPPVLRDYVQCAAESLNVDPAFIFLPMLSSLGAAIGHARSIRLKAYFIQPPIIWTAIVGRSGSRKSPSEQQGCFPILAHEQELIRQNREAEEMFAEELARWEDRKRKSSKPEKPFFLTCLSDDLTIEALAHNLSSNPRGILVAKDELSHLFSSFDQ